MKQIHELPILFNIEGYGFLHIPKDAEVVKVYRSVNDIMFSVIMDDEKPIKRKFKARPFGLYPRDIGDAEYVGSIGKDLHILEER